MSDPASPYGPSPYQTPAAVPADEVRLLPGGFVAPLSPLPLWGVLVFTAVATGITAAMLSSDPGLGLGLWDLPIWWIFSLWLMPLVCFAVFVRICLRWYSSRPHVIAPQPGTQWGLTLLLPPLSFLVFAPAGVTSGLALAILTPWQTEAMEGVAIAAGYFCAASVISLAVRLWYRPDFTALE
jgi:hypothetical protein